MKEPDDRLCFRCGHHRVTHRNHHHGNCTADGTDFGRYDKEGNWHPHRMLCDCPGWLYMNYMFPQQPTAEQLYDAMRKADP